MKKYLWFIFVCSMVLFVFLPICASSAGPNDYSQHISDEILAQLPLKEGDILIPQYVSAIHLDFAEYNNIDEIINSYIAKPQMVVYVIQSLDGTRECYCVLEGKCYKKLYDIAYYRRLDIFLAEEEIKQIDPDIQVEYAYYFNGEADMLGTAIYYKTNLGDYVYYACDGKPIHGTFLFSAEAFFALHRTYYESNRTYDNNVPLGGSESMHDIDLSAYQIGSPNFNPNAKFPTPKPDNSGTLWLISGISLGVILSVAAVWVFLHRRKNTNVPTDPV